MTDEEKSKKLTRSSFAAQMAMLGYEPNGNPKDMVEIVRCKDCKYDPRNNSSPEELPYWFPCKNGMRDQNWFCAEGERQ